jgi:hypothetical protein
MQDIIEETIRDFDWSDLNTHELAMWETASWPKELAEAITRALLTTHLRAPR